MESLYLELFKNHVDEALMDRVGLGSAGFMVGLDFCDSVWWEGTL